MKGKKVLFCSLELSKEQLARRVISTESQISSIKLMTEKVNQTEWVRLGLALQNLANCELYFDDTANITVPTIDDVVEIDKLIASGVDKSSITLLSAFKFESSVASKLKRYKVDLVSNESNDITYSTIQGFKGLENSIIMLVDIHTYNKPDLMYVGMSRARNALYIFETKRAKNYREKL